MYYKFIYFVILFNDFYLLNICIIDLITNIFFKSNLLIFNNNIFYIDFKNNYKHFYLIKFFIENINYKLIIFNKTL